MEFMTFGSKTLDEVIRTHKDIKNELRITNISPFSYHRNRNKKLNILKKNETEYSDKMVALELGNKFPCTDAEYLFLDFVDARMHFEEIELKSGEKIRLTDSNFSKPHREEIRKNIGEIKYIKKIDPMEFSEVELETEIKAFAEALAEDYPDKKIIVLENYHVLNCISKDNQLRLVPNYQKLAEENHFFSICYQKARKYLNAVFLPFPDGMITKDYQNIWSYPTAYYNYIIKSLEALQGGTYDEKMMLKEQRKEMLWEVRQLWLDQTREVLLESFEGRTIVMPKSEIMPPEYLNESGDLDIIILEDEEFVEISNSDNVEDCEYLNRTEFFWFVPLDRIEKNLLNLLWNSGFVPKTDYLCPIHETVELHDFSGDYQDCFGNIVECKDPVDIFIHGSKNRIILHQMMKSFKLSITVYHADNVFMDDNNRTLGDGSKGVRILCGDNCCVSIGKKGVLGIDLTIDAGDFSDISVGDEALISTEVLIKNTLSEKQVWLRKPNLFTRSKITVGNHVWLGLRVNVFSDANIGNDSIVGARSLLKKHFPPNSIIVGIHPNDRILEKKPKITWSRALNGKKLEKIEESEHESN